VHQGGAANPISFVWDGDDLLNERIEGANAARYAVLEGEMLSEKRGASRYRFVPDPLGSVRALLDTSGSIVATRDYWPYGEVAAQSGGMTAIQFVGVWGYFTDTTGRIYIRARHYRPDLGRWVTVDPIGFGGGDWNVYRYAAGAPSACPDAYGLGVRLCWRPVVGNAFICNSMAESHWFLWTRACGCVGWGPHGVIWGCLPNLEPYNACDTECTDLNVTPRQERCICYLARNVDTFGRPTPCGKGRGWVLCGRRWRSDDFHWLALNCQDFVSCLAMKCMGWHNVGPQLPFGPDWAGADEGQWLPQGLAP